MAMVVKNNMTALNTLNTLNKNSSALAKSLQKVSSGMKINSAADDASGYAISERMRVQIRSLDQANQNTQNGSSMMKVAEGAVSSTVEILKTLKEKAVNAANDSNTDADRQTIQKELDQSIDQINDNANVTFNGKYLIDGSKNTVGNATYTALSNQSLSEDTTADTKLTDLASRSGDSLEIHDTDKVTVSYVQGGKTYSTTFQVGDKTLQDIFAAAEDIDKDSKIFATGDNENIKHLGGASGATNEADAINKAIAKLQSQLSSGASTVTTVKSNNTSLTAGDYHTGAGLVTADKSGTTALTAKAYTNDIGVAASAATDAATSGVQTLAAGSLYNAVKDADEALTDAVNNLGNTTTANTLAYKLNQKLTTAGIAWDGESTSLNEADISAKFDSVTGLKDAYEAYKAGVATKDAAEANMATAVSNYTEAQDQLEALTNRKDVLDATAKVEEATALVKAKQDAVASAKASLVNSVSKTLADTANATVAADPTKTPTVNYKSGSDVAANAKVITPGNTGMIATPFESTNANIKTITDKFAQDLALLDTIHSNGGTAAEVKDGADELVGLFKTGATAAGGTAADPTNAITVSTTDIQSAYQALSDAEDALATADRALQRAQAKASAPATANGTNMKEALKSAQDDILSQFSGPAILSGSKVGIGAANNEVETASGKNAITITANTAGISGQISGINISVSDAQGNVKKSANAALDAFEETVRAQNKSDDNAINLQVGAKANQSIKIGLTDMRAEALGLQGADGTKLNISTQNKANAAINVLDNAIQKALDQQTTIGSVESRLEYTSSNLTTASENVQASESTIRDADMAKEMMQYTKNNVLLQAAQSMLAQANQSSSNVLSLLQ